MLCAAICDDEPLAIARLEQLLGRFEGVKIVGTATDGIAALDLIERCAPQLLFLDVEMPVLDGFDLIEALGRRGADGTEAPLVVLVTAHAETAAAAFDTGVVEFLTKPVRLGRLELALARVRQLLAARVAQRDVVLFADELARLREDRGVTADGGRLWVRRHGEAVAVDLNRVARISAEREHVRLHLGAHSLLHRSSLAALLPMLDQQRFVRVHRSHVVARDNIAGLRRTASGDIHMITVDGADIPVGRSYRERVRALRP